MYISIRLGIAGIAILAGVIVLGHLDYLPTTSVVCCVFYCIGTLLIINVDRHLHSIHFATFSGPY